MNLRTFSSPRIFCHLSRVFFYFLDDISHQNVFSIFSLAHPSTNKSPAFSDVYGYIIYNQRTCGFWYMRYKSSFVFFLNVQDLGGLTDFSSKGKIKPNISECKKNFKLHSRITLIKMKAKPLF